MLSIFPCNCLLLYLPCFSTYPPGQVLTSWRHETATSPDKKRWKYGKLMERGQTVRKLIRRPGAQSRMHTKSDYAPDMAAVTASFFPPATAPRICDHVRKDWAIKHWTKSCCVCMVQQLSSGASPVPLRITAPLCCQCDVHVTSYNLAQGIFRLLLQMSHTGQLMDGVSPPSSW